LDGLPLAIELAAARLRVFSPEQILARLDDQFRLLRAGWRAVPARHQTLRAVVDWSYQLCSSPEQTLWARASVFAGGFELAAEGICAGDNLPRLLEALFGLAMNRGMEGDAAGALACHDEVMAITEPRGEVWYRSLSLLAFGLAVWQEGDLRRATGLERESLRLKRVFNDLLGTAWCLEILAWIAAGEPDPRRAATLLGAAHALWRTTGTSPATVRHLLGYHDECEQRTRRALGERAFQAAVQRGMVLGLADAIGYALNEKPQPARSPAPAATTLTRREQQVAELVAQGLTNKDIAARLVIAQRTAEGHVERILTKLGFTTRTQLATWVAGQREGRDR
jgi:DNA-binding CsgD family transcriptional regulator